MSILPSKPSSPLNRWTSGFIQSGTENSCISSSGKFESTRELNARGLTGSGVVVTLLDSGVDTSSPFFFDSSVPLCLNTTNQTHRKIVRYDGSAVDGGHQHGRIRAVSSAGLPCAGMRLIRSCMSRVSGLRMRLICGRLWMRWALRGR
jgi:hypothetical protein